MNRFTFLEAFAAGIENFPEDQQAEAYAAICRYGIYGIEPEPKTIGAAAVNFCRSMIDKGKELSEKRGQSGKNGGEANAKQIRSKREANEKQTGSKQEANADKEKVKIKEKVKDKRDKDIMSSAASVLDALNQSSDRQFKAVDGTLKPIIARLREGRSEEECREIIRKKVAEWKGDPKMDAYLRPETLFSAQHFDSYLNAPEPKPTNRAPNKFHNFDERAIDYDAIIRGEEVG